MKSWQIKNIKIDNPVVLAPMAGVTNQAYREVAKEFGCGLLYGEMLSDKALINQNKHTLKMAEVSNDEHPIALQLFGNEIKSMVEAAIYLDKHTMADIIDINMGCPVNKVVKNNGGVALMKEPDLAYQIVKEIVDQVEKPVTVKLRSGWNEKSINVVEMALKLEAAGASAVAIHPRTKTQMYSGKSNWDIIRQVKDVLKIPVIGNGDIKTYQDAKLMMETTNCDGVMIGRGALGNPWLIKDCVDYFNGREINEAVNYLEVFHYIRKHYQKLAELKSKHTANLEMRSHISWYISGLPYNTKIKSLVNKSQSETELLKLLDNYEDFLKAYQKDDTLDFSYFTRYYD